MGPTIYGNTKTHFILGDPIEHSLSPIIYNFLYARYGINCVSLTAQVKKGDLGLFMQTLNMLRVSALNITIPHKVDIIPFIDVLDISAKEFVSVNSIALRDGKRLGFSTDAQGFSLSLKDAGSTLSGQTMVILGAGGAAAPIAMQAALESATSICILARRPEAAQALSERLKGICAIPCSYDELKNAGNHMEKTSLLVNTTPLGMQHYHADFETLDFIDALPKNAIVYDIVYNPPKTRFLLHAEKRGLKTVNGLGMLIWQACAAFEKYYGILPSSEDVQGILNALNDSSYQIK